MYLAWKMADMCAPDDHLSTAWYVSLVQRTESVMVWQAGYRIEWQSTWDVSVLSHVEDVRVFGSGSRASGDPIRGEC